MVHVRRWGLTAVMVLMLGASGFSITGCGYSQIPPLPDGGAAASGAREDAGVAAAPCLDNDGDGIGGTGACALGLDSVFDCDDQNPAIFPGASELCDGIDQDCSGLPDDGLAEYEYFLDEDEDGHGGGVPAVSCKESIASHVRLGGDCDDEHPDVHPGAREACNSRDDDCDMRVDDNVTTTAFYVDADGDGYGTGAPTQNCASSLPGRSTQAGDCNDGLAAVNPGTTEVCNGVDDDCDGSIDESFPTMGVACDAAVPGVCSGGTLQCVQGKSACVSTTAASAERCDGLDNDCDGQKDETFTTLGRTCSAGVGVCTRTGTQVCRADGTGTQCNATAGPPTAAARDSLDNDCDGSIDELEPIRHQSLTMMTQPTALEAVPFFFTASGCAGGTGTQGIDAWRRYFVAYVEEGRVKVLQLSEEGVALGAALTISPSAGYAEVALAQAGSGVAVVGRQGTTTLDLFYVGEGPAARTVGGQTQVTVRTVTAPWTLSDVRAVRGNGGRVLLLWRETNAQTGESALHFARYAFNALGPGFVAAAVTPPTQLPPTVGGMGAFGVASSHEEYGDSLGCPTGLSRFGLAHRVGSTLRLDVFNEDGTAAGPGTVVYAGAATRLPDEPDVAWTYLGGDRWGVVHTVAFTSPSTDEGLYFWQSGQTAGSTLFGPFFSGKGGASVERPRIVSRPGEFLISGLFHATASVELEPQVRVGRKGHGGVTLDNLSPATVGQGCVGQGCANGPKRLALPLSSASGGAKTEGVLLYASPTGVSSSVIGNP